MGYVSFSIPGEIVLQFQKAGNIQNFVETGTYKGGTSYWAAKYFAKVYTIEIDPAISKSTASHPDCPKNIEFFVGNSKDVLPSVVPLLSGRSLFWLDGHWCNVSDLGKEEECPILEEINAIGLQKDAVILIDDARCFLGPLPPPHDETQWPRIDSIFQCLQNNFPQHRITIVDDVIFCIPPDLLKTFDQYWMASYADRYKPKPNTFIGKVKELLK